MRHLFVLLIIPILWAGNAYGQSAVDSETSDTTAIEKFYVVDKSAEFPGGMGKFYGNYISKNIKYPKDAKKQGVEGKVYVEFVIEATGKIRKESVLVSQGIYPSCDDEAIRLIKECPDWKPGFSSELNKNVPQKFVVPIIFKLK